MVDLRHATQVIVSESRDASDHSRSLVGAEHPWYVASLDTKLALLCAGLGFGWMPRHMLGTALVQETLRVLPLAQGQVTTQPLYLIPGRQAMPGPAARRMGEILRSVCRGADGA